MFHCKPCSGGLSTLLSGVVIAAVTVAGAYTLRDASANPDTPAQPQSAPAQNAPQRGAPDLGAMLAKGLTDTKGCLGIDTATFSSGKNTIFAWFENKEAVLRWYHSEVHKRAMGMFFPGRVPNTEPLAGIPDDYTGPVLAIAAITFASPEEQQKGGAPFTQISIELYAPLKGGIAINGTLAPASMKVPGGRDATEEYAPKGN